MAAAAPLTEKEGEKQRQEERRKTEQRRKTKTTENIQKQQHSRTYTQTYANPTHGKQGNEKWRREGKQEKKEAEKN